ncbi:hypothetical protein [Peribacillus frigoritolerans]|nr:hypothetical protein [Peribacillus frigoritolerans]
MDDIWIYSHFINTAFFPIFLIIVTIFISVIFIRFVTKSKNNE